MTIRTARNGDVEIAYESLGSQSGEPILLVTGIGGQMKSWPVEVCQVLMDRGFCVIRFDNRDAGQSTRLSAAGAPSQLRMVFRPASAAIYTLEDMADDAVAVLDAQGLKAAHIVGMSLGGMIAQTMAVRHPDRVRTLTSISSSPAPRIGQPTPMTMLKLLIRARPNKRVKSQRDTDDFVAGLASLTRSSGYTSAEEGRAGGPAEGSAEGRADGSAEGRADGFGQLTGGADGVDMAAIQRQTAAIAASGDRRSALAHLRVPALILHGEDDQIVRPIAGRATADAIPGARLVTYPGMGHDLPRELWTAMADEIVSLAKRSKVPDSGGVECSAG